MKKVLVIAALCAALVGCGDDKPSDKVMKFLDTQDIWMLSKSKTSMCTEAGLKKIHFVDENVLPTTNDYYQVSKYLYGKSHYSVVSERKDGDSYIVTIKFTYPKAIDDAKAFLEADSPYISDRDKKDLDNLKALYESGGLSDLEYTEYVNDWVVLDDGIDPKFSKEQEVYCSES
ncbi:hypothetical protein ACRWUA_14565 [Escherichia coli]